MNSHYDYSKFSGMRKQKGLTTLAITLLLLVILTLIVLFSTNVAFFEQRTTNNENRSRLVEQAAEYAINLAGEYMKANRNNIISITPTTGWLSTGGRKWAECDDVGTADNNLAPDSEFPAGHVCLTERNATRRAQLLFYTANGTTTGSQTVPYRTATPDAIELETTGVGGTAAFTTAATVRALLCRIDTSLATPACARLPVAGNRIAITLIADASLPNENSSAQMKQTWATYSASSPSAAVPLVASGLIKGVGNAQIVVSPNAGGYGIPAAMWSPCPIDIDANTPSVIAGCAVPGPGASVGSVSTCHLGEYLKSTPENQLLTTCATVNNACNCPAINSAGSDFLSGHSGSVKKENYDILDRDGGNGALPDITFFPGNGIDKATVDNDDSLFEWIFAVSYEASEASTDSATLQNCTVTAAFDAAKPTNCAVAALENDLGAQSIANCSGLGPDSSGIYYVRGTCNLPDQVGSPGNFVIVVVNDSATLNGTIFYGMLFIRSNNNSAEFKGVGNSKVFGSVVVQGEVDIAGTLDLVYVDTSVSADVNTLPTSAKFALVPGSWLDNQSGL